jgi:uncharacterized protein (DUF427 family)
MVEHNAYMEPMDKRIQATYQGEIIVDSKNVLVMRETNHEPVYYFPFKDVRMDLMEPTAYKTH